jgi:hypothetical protein
MALGVGSQNWATVGSQNCRCEFAICLLRLRQLYIPAIQFCGIRCPIYYCAAHSCLAMVAVQEGLIEVWAAAEEWMFNAAGKCADVPQFLAARFPTCPAVHAHCKALQALEARAVSILTAQQLGKSNCLSPQAWTRVWQYTVGHQFSHVGSSTLPAVLRCMKASLFGESIPVDAGRHLLVSCHCACLVAVELHWLDPESNLANHPAMQQEVAKYIIKCLQLHCATKQCPSSSSGSRPQPSATQLGNEIAKLAAAKGDSMESILANYSQAQPSQVYLLHKDDTRARNLLEDWADICRAHHLTAPADITGSSSPPIEQWLLADPWIQEDIELPELDTKLCAHVCMHVHG